MKVDVKGYKIDVPLNFKVTHMYLLMQKHSLEITKLHVYST